MADDIYNGMPATDLPDLQWRLAGSTDGGVEMARLPDGQVAVRNAADPKGPALIYTKAEIEALIGGAQDGDFDGLLALPTPTARGPPTNRWGLTFDLENRTDLHFLSRPSATNLAAGYDNAVMPPSPATTRQAVLSPMWYPCTSDHW